jgi:hypothetical protein
MSETVPRTRIAPGAPRIVLVALLLAAGGCARWPHARFAPASCSSPASAALMRLGRALNGDYCGCAYALTPTTTQDLPHRLDGTDEP